MGSPVAPSFRRGLRVAVGTLTRVRFARVGRVAGLAGLAGLGFAAGCGGDASDLGPPLRAERLPDRDARDGDAPLFRRIAAAESGLSFTNELRPAHLLPYLYNGAGVTVGDCDGDGRPDVYLVSQDGPNKLFRQVDMLRFEDVTDAAGVDGGDAWGAGASFADVDGDGDLDLYVCNTESPNKLYVNRGDGRFDERAQQFGLAHVGASTMPAFADYDNDGDLDLYLVANRVFSPQLRTELLEAVELPGEVQKSIDEMAPPRLRARGDLPVQRRQDGGWSIPPELREHLVEVEGVDDTLFFGGQRDRLFRNEGGRFVDVTVRAGIRDQGMGLSATWWDFDDDGWLDLYVANDLESPDLLYRNHGDGSFVEVTANTLPHVVYFGMGSDAADVDNDGDLDLIVADMAMRRHYDAKMLMGDMSDRSRFLADARPPQIMRNALFVNTGTSRFMEVGYLAGVARTDWTWAVKFADLDEDGWVDLYVTNGVARFDSNPDLAPRVSALMRAGLHERALELERNVPALRERNIAFHNRTVVPGAAPRFEDVSAAWGVDHEGLSNGAAFCDFDGDGDLDIVVNNLNDEALLYENLADRNHRIVVALRGRQSERHGLGARVIIESGGMRQVRLLTLSHGYLSTDQPLVHFGLGSSRGVDRLEVRWPSGARQSFERLDADHRYTITEPPDADGSRIPAAAALVSRSEEPAFADVTTALGLVHRHVERPCDDFASQPLLPHKHSQLGPGLAWGDCDGDGDDDLFVGGAAGQPGRLFRAQSSGFEPVEGPWTRDAACEDQGALWFDADGDRDLDLYVVSGSSEFGRDDERLRDRLYLNRGGEFERAPEGTLPDHRDSGSCVVAADFDRDGDLDLFVGSRVVPGRYPMSPHSRLLRNDGGRFVSATAAIAPELQDAGLVTSAIWSDVDDDGWQDLLVTAHWQPIRLFRNVDARLVEATETSGIGGMTGLWNGIAGADLDGDGDVDYVVTNLGLNTKYHADLEHPARIFCKDFDGDGVLDVVEAKSDGQSLLPVRGRSCSSRAMPFLAERFPTFDEFARATLEEIYTPRGLDSAASFEANELAHVVLVNDGRGRFEAQPLPRLAQAAPAFGVALCDFDGDGDVDAWVAHNFFSNEPETGRMAGGVSLLLHNRGDAVFEPVQPSDSGLVVPHDAKGLAVCDVNHDGWPDLSVAANDGPLRVFRSRGVPDVIPVALHLEGRDGNPTALGARVSVPTPNGSRVVEVTGGSGYLGQSTATVFFSTTASTAGATVAVRWPDGSRTEASVDDARSITLRPD